MAMDSYRKTQIKARSGAQVGALIFDKAALEVWAKYIDYSNIFSSENVAELWKHTKMIDHAF